MMKLFMISLGGKAKKANIEVHDVQFAIGDTIEAVVPLIKANWYGLGLKLHMDSYKEINGVKGYEIQVSEEIQQNDKKLYFAYLGGYQKESTQEVHDVRLLMAGSAQEAKANGTKDGRFTYAQPHVDSVVDVEKKMLTPEGESYFLKFNPCGREDDLLPDWYGYRRLDTDKD